MTLTEAAEKTVAVIDRDGWWGGWDDTDQPGNRVCLRWALHRAEKESGMCWRDRYHCPFWLLSERCDVLARTDGYTDGVQFNDRTSEEDVKLLLKRAGSWLS